MTAPRRTTATNTGFFQFNSIQKDLRLRLRSIFMRKHYDAINRLNQTFATRNPVKARNPYRIYRTTSPTVTPSPILIQFARGMRDQWGGSPRAISDLN